MPLDLPLKLWGVIVSKSQFWVKLLLAGREVECKQTFLNEVLIHHVVKHRSHTFLSEFGICHTYNCLDLTVEDSLLFLNVSESLILNLDRMLTFSNLEIVIEKVAWERAWTKLNKRFLLRLLDCWRFGIIVGFFFISKNFFIQDPGITGASVEHCYKALRWRTNTDLTHIGHIVVVD